MKEIERKHDYIELSGENHSTGIHDGMQDIFRFFAKHSKAGVE
jgi:hypothetical protein